MLTQEHGADAAPSELSSESWKGAIGPGVHSLSFDDYRGLPGLNWHTLEPFRKSAKAGRHAMLRPSDASAVQVMGGAVHAAILEPATFATQYATMPAFEGHPNTTAHKDAKKAWIAANEHRIGLKADEWATCAAMQAAAKAHPLASAMLYGKGRNEATLVWDDADTGRRCKGRVDRIARVKVGAVNPLAANAADDAICLIDLKTTRSVDYRDFSGDFARFAYHGQLAYYLDGLQAIKPAPYSVFVVAIENAPPFDVVVYQIGDDEIDHGRRLYRRLMDKLIACEQSDNWPGISERAVPLFLPDWAKESES